MSSSHDTLRLCFPAHGDSVLSKINALREERRFCDVTLLLGGAQGASVRPLHFHGHRAVIAASSDFLRDQFMLHEGRAELSVGVVSNVEVGKRLLLSCYTGLLEVPLSELVSYLTAASALQMSQVVEKCAQVISHYLTPTLALFKLEKHSEEEEIQQSDWPGPSFKNQEERDAVQPSSSIQEVITDEGEAVEIHSKLRCSQGAKVDGQGLRVVRDRRGAIVAQIDLSEDAACCVEAVESEEGGDIRAVHTKKPSHQVHHATGAPRCKLHPPMAVRDQISPTTGGSSAQHEDLANSPQKQEEEAEKEQREEEEVLLLAAQLQQCRELMDSNLFCVPGHSSGGEPAEDPDSILIQRPYLCRRCDRVFQHLESYVGHLKEHRQYLCLVCGKGFSQRSSLTRHIHVHTGVKLFRCPLCHKTFSQKATLQDHLNLHTGDKPHECKYCAVHFAHKPGLRRHLKDIHGKSSLQNMLDEADD